jgi:hypothetical protein
VLTVGQPSHAFFDDPENGSRALTSPRLLIAFIGPRRQSGPARRMNDQGLGIAGIVGSLGNAECGEGTDLPSSYSERCAWDDNAGRPDHPFPRVWVGADAVPRVRGGLIEAAMATSSRRPSACSYGRPSALPRRSSPSASATHSRAGAPSSARPESPSETWLSPARQPRRASITREPPHEPS